MIKFLQHYGNPLIYGYTNIHNYVRYNDDNNNNDNNNNNKNNNNRDNNNNNVDEVDDDDHAIYHTNDFYTFKDTDDFSIDDKTSNHKNNNYNLHYDSVIKHHEHRDNYTDALFEGCYYPSMLHNNSENINSDTNSLNCLDLYWYFSNMTAVNSTDIPFFGNHTFHPFQTNYRFGMEHLNVSEATTIDSPLTFVALPLLFFPVLTVFGNILVVLSVFTDKNLQSVTNYFIVSLAVADIMVAIFVMPLAVYVEVNNSRWLLGDKLCDVWVALDVLCCTASILNLTAISVDRYFAVTRPIQYAHHKNSKRVYFMLGLTWIISVAISSPIVFGANYTERRSQTSELCTFYNSDFLIYSSMGSFYIPCILMILLYGRIFKAIRTRAKKSAMQKRVKTTVKCQIQSLNNDTMNVSKAIDETNLGDQNHKKFTEISTSFQNNKNNPNINNIVSNNNNTPNLYNCNNQNKPNQNFSKNNSLIQGTFEGQANDERAIIIGNKNVTNLTAQKSLHQSDPNEKMDSLVIQNSIITNKYDVETSKNSNLIKSQTINNCIAGSAISDDCGNFDQNNVLCVKKEGRNPFDCESQNMEKSSNSKCGCDSKGDDYLDDKVYIERNQNEHAQQINPMLKIATTINHNVVITSQGSVMNPDMDSIFKHSSLGNDRSVLETHLTLKSTPMSINKVQDPITKNESNSNNQIQRTFTDPTIYGSSSAKQSCKTFSDQEHVKRDKIDVKTIHTFYFRFRKTKAKKNIKNEKKLQSSQRRERKATKTLAIVLGVFLFCWVPFFTINIMNAICIRYDLISGVCELDPKLFSFFVWLGYMNSFLNPVIYTIFNAEFRKAFKRLLKCFFKTD